MVGVRGREQCGGDPKVCPRDKGCHVSLTEGDLLEQRPSGRDPGVGRSDVGNCFGETKCTHPGGSWR